MQNSTIEWTDTTWNPVTGCTKVSQGCKNCYAEKMYERFNGKGSFKKVITHEDRLLQPFKWKEQKKIFVNSMSDLFHEDVPFEFIDKVFAIMAATPHHTYQLLTKRPENMVEWFQGRLATINTALDIMADYFEDTGNELLKNKCINASISINVENWPLKNVWLGVSVEDQKAADERIPYLLQIPAAVRFLSCEPLLGPVDLTFSINNHKRGPAKIEAIEKIDWVITGGESGHGARPVHPDWIRSLRDQCYAANVPFFFKQWGEWQDGSTPNQNVKHIAMLINGDHTQLHNAYKGEAISGSIYQTDVWNKLHPKVMSKVGKKKAGNILDGEQHLEFPNV